MSFRYTLPNVHRPKGLYLRKVSPGIDFPCGFLDDLKAIDNRLYVVWSKYRTEKDPCMNVDTGKIEDPRFAIAAFETEEAWGWVLRNPDNSPILENMWHIWEFHSLYGWSHVCRIESTLPVYLALLVKRIYLQGYFNDKYGKLAYMKFLRAKEHELQESEKNDLAGLNMAVMEENKWLLNKAMDNLSSGRINATNPTVDKIISYPGQHNRSRIVRPMTDTEGGLILPDRFKTGE